MWSISRRGCANQGKALMYKWVYWEGQGGSEFHSFEAPQTPLSGPSPISWGCPSPAEPPRGPPTSWKYSRSNIWGNPSSLPLVPAQCFCGQTCTNHSALLLCDIQRWCTNHEYGAIGKSEEPAGKLLSSGPPLQFNGPANLHLYPHHPCLP